MARCELKHKRKIVFLTGTRADYGKLKSLMRMIEKNEKFELYIFATGMHMLKKYGSTYKEIIKDGFNNRNMYYYINQQQNNKMDIILSNTILGFSNYISEIEPDAIVVHGDRLEALAGAIVGAFNNIRVFHIEGGEVSGTIDESIRHAITKFSHFHFVSNENAKSRIIQLGEDEQRINVIGSPDIDIMNSKNLPSIGIVKNYYNIPFKDYNILMYHPVTTEIEILPKHIKQIVEGIINSNQNFVIIYPNNDNGSDIILNEINKLRDNIRFRVIPSMRFEYFLTLLKNCKVMVGNSSSGIYEAGAYGKPVIDIGTRQSGRYNELIEKNIFHIEEDKNLIVKTLNEIKELKFEPKSYYGKGNSNELFLDILLKEEFWDISIQKKFVDLKFN